MEILILVFIFIIGLCFGSFFKLVADRGMEPSQILTSRSHCDNCGKRVPWQGLVPVLGYFLLNRRCLYCKKTIDWTYPVIELIYGIASVLIYKISISIHHMWGGCYLFYIAFPIAVIDFRYRIIPNYITYSTFVVSLIWIYFSKEYAHFGGFFVTIVIVLFSYLFKEIRGYEGIGMGDLKYMFSVTLFLGALGVLWMITVASLLGILYAVYLYKNSWKPEEKITIPFGPFLAIGSLVAFFMLFAN